MRAGEAPGEIKYSVLCILYANDMPTPSRHNALAFYADGTVIVATAPQPVLLVNYLESYPFCLERWLR